MSSRLTKQRSVRASSLGTTYASNPAFVLSPPFHWLISERRADSRSVVGIVIVSGLRVENSLVRGVQRDLVRIRVCTHLRTKSDMHFAQ